MSHVQPAFFAPKCTYARFTFFKSIWFQGQDYEATTQQWILKRHLQPVEHWLIELWDSRMWALHCTQGQWDVTAQPLRPSLLLDSAAGPNTLLRLSENQTPQTSWGWKNLSKSYQTNQILQVQPMPVVCLTTERELPSPEPVTPKFHGSEGFQSCYLPWITGWIKTGLHCMVWLKAEFSLSRL